MEVNLTSSKVCMAYIQKTNFVYYIIISFKEISKDKNITTMIGERERERIFLKLRNYKIENCHFSVRSVAI